MEAGFRQRLLTGTMLAGGALFGVGGAPTPAEAASCTTIVDNTGSMGQMAGTSTTDCTSLITLSPKGSLNISDPAGKANYDGTDDTCRFHQSIDKPDHRAAPHGRQSWQRDFCF
jgi:hypothetical protein